MEYETYETYETDAAYDDMYAGNSKAKVGKIAYTLFWIWSKQRFQIIFGRDLIKHFAQVKSSHLEEKLKEDDAGKTNSVNFISHNPSWEIAFKEIFLDIQFFMFVFSCFRKRRQSCCSAWLQFFCWSSSSSKVLLSHLQVDKHFLDDQIFGTEIWLPKKINNNCKIFRSFNLLPSVYFDNFKSPSRGCFIKWNTAESFNF